MTTVLEIIERARNTGNLNSLTDRQLALYEQGVKRGIIEPAPPDNPTGPTMPVEPAVPVPFDTFGTGYDMETAVAAGMTRDPVTKHWGSREPKSGLVLKGMEHKTYGEAVEVDRKAGYEHYLGSDKGRIYSLQPGEVREDGTRKNQGWTGRHKMLDGSDRYVSDMSAKGGLIHNGQLIDYPILVSTLNKNEITHILKGGEITPGIQRKAVEHAQRKLERGESPFKVGTSIQTYTPLEAYAAYDERDPNISHNVASALYRGLVEGVSTELPSMIGLAMQFTNIPGIKQVGKKLADWAEEMSHAMWKNDVEYAGFAGWVHEAGKMIPTSVTPMGASMQGAKILLKLARLRKVVNMSQSLRLRHIKNIRTLRAAHGVKAAKKLTGYKHSRKILSMATKRHAKWKPVLTKAETMASRITSGSVAGLFGLSAAQRTMDVAMARIEKLEESGDFEAANRIRKGLWFKALATGLVEGTGEYLGTKYLAKLFGVTEKAIASRGASQYVKEWLMSVGKTMGVEVGTEVGQQGGQAAIEKYTDIRPEARIFSEMVDVIGPTMVMTLLLGGASGGINLPHTKQALKNNQEAFDFKRQRAELLAVESGLKKQGASSEEIHNAIQGKIKEYQEANADSFKTGYNRAEQIDIITKGNTTNALRKEATKRNLWYSKNNKYGLRKSYASKREIAERILYANEAEDLSQETSAEPFEIKEAIPVSPESSSSKTVKVEEGSGKEGKELGQEEVVIEQGSDTEKGTQKRKVKKTASEEQRQFAEKGATRVTELVNNNSLSALKKKAKEIGVADTGIASAIATRIFLKEEKALKGKKAEVKKASLGKSFKAKSLYDAYKESADKGNTMAESIVAGGTKVYTKKVVNIAKKLLENPPAEKTVAKEAPVKKAKAKKVAKKATTKKPDKKANAKKAPLKPKGVYVSLTEDEYAAWEAKTVKKEPDKKEAVTKKPVKKKATTKKTGKKEDKAYTESSLPEPKTWNSNVTKEEKSKIYENSLTAGMDKDGITKKGSQEKEQDSVDYKNTSEWLNNKSESTLINMLISFKIKGLDSALIATMPKGELVKVASLYLGGREGESIASAKKAAYNTENLGTSTLLHWVRTKDELIDLAIETGAIDAPMAQLEKASKEVLVREIYASLGKSNLNKLIALAKGAGVKIPAKPTVKSVAAAMAKTNGPKKAPDPNGTNKDTSEEFLRNQILKQDPQESKDSSDQSKKLHAAIKQKTDDFMKRMEKDLGGEHDYNIEGTEKSFTINTPEDLEALKAHYIDIWETVADSAPTRMEELLSLVLPKKSQADKAARLSELMFTVDMLNKLPFSMFKGLHFSLARTSERTSGHYVGHYIVQILRKRVKRMVTAHVERLGFAKDKKLNAELGKYISDFRKNVIKEAEEGTGIRWEELKGQQANADNPNNETWQEQVDNRVNDAGIRWWTNILMGTATNPLRAEARARMMPEVLKETDAIMDELIKKSGIQEDMIRIFTSRDLTTFVHELGHRQMYRLLNDDELKQAIDVYNEETHAPAAQAMEELTQRFLFYLQNPDKELGLRDVPKSAAKEVMYGKGDPGWESEVEHGYIVGIKPPALGHIPYNVDTTPEMDKSIVDAARHISTLIQTDRRSFEETLNELAQRYINGDKHEKPIIRSASTFVSPSIRTGKPSGSISKDDFQEAVWMLEDMPGIEMPEEGQTKETIERVSGYNIYLIDENSKKKINITGTLSTDQYESTTFSNLGDIDGFKDGYLGTKDVIWALTQGIDRANMHTPGAKWRVAVEYLSNDTNKLGSEMANDIMRLSPQDYIIKYMEDKDSSIYADAGYYANEFQEWFANQFAVYILENMAPKAGQSSEALQNEFYKYHNNNNRRHALTDTAKKKRSVLRSIFSELLEKIKTHWRVIKRRYFLSNDSIKNMEAIFNSMMSRAYREDKEGTASVRSPLSTRDRDKVVSVLNANLYNNKTVDKTVKGTLNIAKEAYKALGDEDKKEGGSMADEIRSQILESKPNFQEGEHPVESKLEANIFIDEIRDIFESHPGGDFMQKRIMARHIAKASGKPSPKGTWRDAFMRWGNKNKVFRGLQSFFLPFHALENQDFVIVERSISRGRIDRIQDMATRLNNDLKKFSIETRKEIFQYMDGMFDREGRGKIDPQAINMIQDKKAHSTALQLRKMQVYLGNLLSKKGLLDEDARKALEGKYIHYMYLRNIIGWDFDVDYEALVHRKKGGSGGATLDLGQFKGRQDLTQRQKDELGLIQDAAVAVPYGMGRALSDLAKYDYLAALADENAGIVFPGTKIPMGKKDGKSVFWGFGRLDREIKIQKNMLISKRGTGQEDAIASRLKSLEATKATYLKHLEKAEQEGKLDDYRKVPSSPAYGNIGGMHIRKEVWADIEPLVSTISSSSNAGKVLQFLATLNTQSTGLFKAGKVALNPPTAFRNIISNILQNNMRGRNLGAIPYDMYEAFLSFKNKDQFYKEAKALGIFTTNWSAEEIAGLLEEFREARGNWGKFLKAVSKASSYYGKIDDFSKLAIYRQLRTSGKLNRFGIASGVPMSQHEALLDSLKWGMDYSLASRSIKHLRRHILPFGTYQYKIAPLILESLARNPFIIGKYMAFIGIGSMSIAQAAVKALHDIDDDEWDRMLKNLPAYIKQNKTFIPLPWKSPDGDWQWVNGEYFMPWGTWSSMVKDVFVDQEFARAFKGVGVGNPTLQAYKAISSGRPGSPPVDPFTQKPLWNALDPIPTQYLKMMSWVGNQVLPSVIENIAIPSAETQGAVGRSYRWTKGAITGKPYKDKWYRTLSASQAWGRWVGFNVTPISHRQGMAIKQARIRVKRLEFRKIQRNPNISNAKKLKYRKRLNREISAIRKGEK